MTYCLAIKTSTGIVCAANARTNAGVDNVNRYSKMHVFVEPGQRAFVLVTAGNLATTQAVVSTLQRDFDNRRAERSLRTMDFMFDAADYLGELSCAVQSRHREFNQKATIDPGASFILGGQITGQRYDTLRRARGDGLRGRFRVCRPLPGRRQCIAPFIQGQRRWTGCPDRFRRESRHRRGELPQR
ncbi:MAG: proteasome-type protease [Gammaproteobacteria bacterium]|nr:MAG: proteasome-type protease [Gammaproteobacteria bacterium]